MRKSNLSYLLDTHILIWWMEQNPKLKPQIGKILQDPKNVVFLSVASIWEMVIKIKLGKLRLPKKWQEDIQRSRFEILPINLDHALELERLPQLHKDPFDRMLVAQANAEKATLITTDSQIKRYKVPTI